MEVASYSMATEATDDGEVSGISDGLNGVADARERNTRSTDGDGKRERGKSGD